jgi:cobyrinic acid a,c-diamide synthase
MVGAIQADTVMHEKPQGRGYVKLTETRDHPWPESNSDEPAKIPAHEFHYSSLNVDNAVNYAYNVERGTGIDGSHDGIVYKNVLGCYSHLRDVNKYHWVQRFLQFVEKIAKQRKQNS